MWRHVVRPILPTLAQVAVSAPLATDPCAARLMFIVATYSWRTPGQDPCKSGVPNATRLAQNTPNPFNPKTTIAFALPRPESVTLTVHDLAGRLVRTLVSGEPLPAGRHERDWWGRDERGRRVASGVYLYRLEAGSYNETKRMTLLK